MSETTVLENKVETTEASIPIPEAPKPEATEEQKAYIVCDRELKAFLRKLTSSYGNSDARREAWMASAIYPFAKDDPKFTFTEAKELYTHFMELNSAKFVMFLHGMEREGRIKILQPLTESPEKEFPAELTPETKTEGEKNESL